MNSLGTKCSIRNLQKIEMKTNNRELVVMIVEALKFS